MREAIAVTHRLPNSDMPDSDMPDSDMPDSDAALFHVCKTETHPTSALGIIQSTTRSNSLPPQG